MQAGAGPIAAFRQPPAVEGVTDPKHDDPGGCLSAPHFRLEPPEAADVPFVATMVTHRAGAWQADIASQYDYVLWIDSDLVEYPPDIPTTLIAANPEARPRPAPATSRQHGTGSPAPRWRRATRPRDRCPLSHSLTAAPTASSAQGVTAPLVLLEEPGPQGTDQFYDTTAFVLRGRSGISDDRSGPSAPCPAPEPPSGTRALRDSANARCVPCTQGTFREGAQHEPVLPVRRARSVRARPRRRMRSGAAGQDGAA